MLRSTSLALVCLLLAGCAADVLDEPLGKSSLAAERVVPVVGPLLETRWGQSGAYQGATPLKDGARTYPGCTTIATAQVLRYYGYQDHATSDVCYSLEHAPLSGPDVVDGSQLCVALTGQRYDWDAMASDARGASSARIAATARFIYHVGATLNAQYGGGQGTSATGRQIENAFRQQWGFTGVPRRQMSIISRDAFGYDDAEWAAVIRGELDAGRPVLYMALQEDANEGHAFVIDGYATNGLVHVNWGWGGTHDGWYELATMQDPSGRRWIRDAMIFRGLEPTPGYAAAMRATPPAERALSWHGVGSLVSHASGTATGYGLTRDEIAIQGGLEGDALTLLQWQLDARDGARLEIAGDAATRATITLGTWGSRSADREYRDVALPFVLDPAREGLSTEDGEFFVVAVQLVDASAGALTARATTAAASSASSVASSGVRVDGHRWAGNGSLISRASGTRTGYGLTTDEVQVHPGSEAPVVFFQWEIDVRDGQRLRLSGEGLGGATLRYGAWNDRSADVSRRVTLPVVLDPAADGIAAGDGEYVVVSLALDAAPASTRTVVASIER